MNPSVFARLSLLLLLCVTAGTRAALADGVTYDFSAVPTLEKELLKGDEARIYTEDRAPKYVLTRFVVDGTSADEWKTAFEVMNTLRKNEPKSPHQWYERFMKAGEESCPSEWTVISESSTSLTFERRSPACPPHEAQIALYRVLYGKREVFALIATTKGEMTTEERAAWLRLLESAKVRS